MKKQILIFFCVLFSAICSAESTNCPIVLEPDTNSASPIAIWGADYQPCIYKEWYLVIPEEQGEYVEFNYIIDLNPNSAIDFLAIYVKNENGEEEEILNYNYQPIADTLMVRARNGYVRIVFLSELGNAGELYRGFRLSYRVLTNGNVDQIFYSNVGIGIQPQEKLHINGAIRGDGANGSLRIHTPTGTTEIGSVSTNYSNFYTDRPAFFFNKPIYIAGGNISTYGSGVNNKINIQTSNLNRLTIDGDGYVGIGTDTPQYKLDVKGITYIETSYGYLQVGAVNNGFMHFYTNRPKFYFNKPISIQNGIISSIERVDLQLQTFNTTHLRIQYGTGNVGIGTDNPTQKLDVNGNIRTTDTIFSSIVKTQKIVTTDTIKATHINAESLLVTLPNGADFVFEENYQLRSLEDINAYIHQNKHLPEIPSATEMQESGVSLDKLVIQLLQKIEELTIYTIQQEERIKELENCQK